MQYRPALFTMLMYIGYAANLFCSYHGYIVYTYTAGGVIEDNEVFGNKFDGICLATGVNPKLKGEL